MSDRKKAKKKKPKGKPLRYETVLEASAVLHRWLADVDDHAIRNSPPEERAWRRWMGEHPVETQLVFAIRRIQKELQLLGTGRPTVGGGGNLPQEDLASYLERTVITLVDLEADGLALRLQDHLQRVQAAKGRIEEEEQGEAPSDSEPQQPGRASGEYAARLDELQQWLSERLLTMDRPPVEVQLVLVTRHVRRQRDALRRWLDASGPDIADPLEDDLRSYLDQAVDRLVDFGAHGFATQLRELATPVLDARAKAQDQIARDSTGQLANEGHNTAVDEYAARLDQLDAWLTDRVRNRFWRQAKPKNEGSPARPADEEKVVSRPGWEPKSGSNHAKVIEALYHARAFESATRLRSEDIAARIGKGVDAVKKAAQKLVPERYVHSSGSRGGGYWLSKKGRKYWATRPRTD